MWNSDTNIRALSYRGRQAPDFQNPLNFQQWLLSVCQQTLIFFLTGEFSSPVPVTSASTCVSCIFTLPRLSLQFPRLCLLSWTSFGPPQRPRTRSVIPKLVGCSEHITLLIVSFYLQHTRVKQTNQLEQSLGLHGLELELTLLSRWR